MHRRPHTAAGTPSDDHDTPLASLPTKLSRTLVADRPAVPSSRKGWWLAVDRRPKRAYALIVVTGGITYLTAASRGIRVEIVDLDNLEESNAAEVRETIDTIRRLPRTKERDNLLRDLRDMVLTHEGYEKAANTRSAY